MDRASDELIPLVHLAQQGLNTQGWLRLMGWIGVIAALLVVCLAAMMYMKKRVTRGESEKTTSSGLLDHLREMKRNGELSEEEFEAAKRKIAEKLKGEMGRGDRAAGRGQDSLGDGV